MELTETILEAGRSRNGAWSTEQLSLLGVDGPHPHGWKRQLLGEEYPDWIIDEFLRLKDDHLKPLPNN